jgi:hypothetical protein
MGWICLGLPEARAAFRSRFLALELLGRSGVVRTASGGDVVTPAPRAPSHSALGGRLPCVRTWRGCSRFEGASQRQRASWRAKSPEAPARAAGVSCEFTVTRVVTVTAAERLPRPTLACVGGA